jgi:hypothetical protein
MHLEEQTKDILKRKSVSKYNHQRRGEASEVGGGGMLEKFTWNLNLNVKNLPEV